MVLWCYLPSPWASASSKICVTRRAINLSLRNNMTARCRFRGHLGVIKNQWQGRPNHQFWYIKAKHMSLLSAMLDIRVVANNFDHYYDTQNKDSYFVGHSHILITGKPTTHWRNIYYVSIDISKMLNNNNTDASTQSSMKSHNELRLYLTSGRTSLVAFSFNKHLKAMWHIFTFDSWVSITRHWHT